MKKYNTLFHFLLLNSFWGRGEGNNMLMLNFRHISTGLYRWEFNLFIISPLPFTFFSMSPILMSSFFSPILFTYTIFTYFLLFHQLQTMSLNSSLNKYGGKYLVNRVPLVLLLLSPFQLCHLYFKFLQNWGWFHLHSIPEMELSFLYLMTDQFSKREVDKPVSI